MPTNVLMPQLGESIAEGTIVRWVKKVGDAVERDEPLFEISTDKVDAEIPSPAAGVLAEIRAREGETVPVDTVVAVIGQKDEAVAIAETKPTAAAPRPEPAERTGREPVRTSFRGQGTQRRSSPVVRRLARAHDVNVDEIAGSGRGGRVTKRDVLQHLEARRSGAVEPAPAAAADRVVFGPGETTRVVQMSIMRRKIAERMVLSRRTSAHVHTVFEVDFSDVLGLRERHKVEGEKGGRLTVLAFIARAAVQALEEMPVVNASLDGDRMVFQRDVNLGIAVALQWGLIVPVIKQAQSKSVRELAAAIADLADRARTKRLMPADVEGGTFTITNPGVFGSLYGLPIINHPQSAILCVGAVEKRAVVVDDQIVARPRAYLALGFDHRLIDGAVADQFMSKVKSSLERFEQGWV